MHEATVIARPRAQIFIERPRLTKLLDEAGARIILLLAPAGYGKTTLAQQWTRGRETVGWFMGGPSMIDVAGLSVGMVETLAAMGEPRREDLVERVRILAARGHDARGLAKAVSAAAPGPDWLLVIDDYHHALGSEDAEAFLEELVALTEFRLLITSRERPTWLPARKVIYGEAAVIEMDALAFTDEEALEVLGGRGEELVAEARGWPAVIGLAAMRGRVDVAAGLPPDELYRFFAEDLFQSASPRLREAMFLLALAGVDGARALLGSDHAELLVEAAERGFLTGGEQRVVHPLLRAFLVAKMSDIDQKRTQVMVSATVEFFIECRRWDDCLALLERFPEGGLILSSLTRGLTEMLDSGRIATVKTWIDLAGRARLENPILLLAEAEVALRERDDRRAQALGERAGTLLEDDLASRSYLVAAFAAHFSDTPSESSRLSKLAFLSAPNAHRRVDALWLEFNSALERSVAEAKPFLRRLEEFGPIDASHALRLRTAQGLMLCQLGDVLASMRALEVARGLLDTVRDPFPRTNLLHFLAYTYLLAAQYEAAVSAAVRLAEEGRDSGLRFAAEYAALRKAGAYVGMRRLGQAQAALEEVRRPVDATPDFISSNAVLQRVRLAITSGDLERASVLLASEIKGGERPAFRGETNAYKALVAAARGELDVARDAISGNQDRAYVEADALSTVAVAIIALQSNEDAVEAAASLKHLLVVGEADAIVMGYRAYPGLAAACVGTEIEPQIADLLARSRDIGLARSIGLNIPREIRPRQRLSPREQEVYDLLVQGLATRDIAKTLFISESTTKVHIRHIFEKLGVHSRAEAARIVGLHGPA